MTQTRLLALRVTGACADHRARLRLTVLALALLATSAAAQTRNLAPEAAYSVTLYGYAYAGQVIPGTNTPATAHGFMPAPPWLGPADALTDGLRGGAIVRSWFWSNMAKRIAVRFDLRRAARVSQVRLWPNAGEAPCDRATARIAASQEGLAQAAELVLEPVEEGLAWSGGPLEGRFIEILCASGAPQMSLAEVEILGEPTGELAEGAPPAGLIAVPPRDLTALVTLPDRPEGAVNLARMDGVKVALSSGHHDDKTGRWVDDNCAAESDPGGRNLVDGNRATAVRSFEGWYAQKKITADIDLGRAARVDRVVVRSTGHGERRSFINCFKVWLQAGAKAPWVPAGEVWNPLLPGEVPGPEYPVFSPVIDRPATALRVELTGVAQSADVMQVGEIEIWGAPTGEAIAAREWSVKKPVPQVEAVTMGELDRAYDWLRKERLRGLYGYVGQWKDTDLLDRTVAAGFNCMLVHTMSKAHSEAGWPEEVGEWARVQAERNLRVIISWPFGSDERYGNTQFGAYQPGGAVTWQRGPCPLSREYWEKVVGDRAVIAAEAGLTGLVVDMEMYGADATRYPGPCYCDDCWARFVGDHLEGIAPDEIPIQDRPTWIAANGLARDYARYQELQVTAILTDIRERVRAVNPRFLLGNLLDPESLAGLARGFGTPTMPALVFSELEYNGGIAGTPGRVEQLRREGYPVWYVPGLWIRPVTPPMLPELVAAVAPATGGYWIWSTAAFSANPRGEYAHAPEFSHEDYWQAFRRANDALDAALASGDGGVASERREVPSARVPRIAGDEPTAQDWERAAILEPFVAYSSGEPAKTLTRARALWDGERLHLRVTCTEPEPHKMTPLHGERDDASLWQQDSLEVFWRRPDTGAYAHVVVNAAGAVSDSFSDGIRPEDPGWNADISAVPARGEGQWEMRLSIPLAADGGGDLPPGSQVCFELARNRPGGGETTCWAPTGGMFRGAPNLWGTLELE